MGFASDIAKFIKKTGARQDLILRKVAFDAFGSIVMNTPWDTGRARGSWRVGVNRTDLSVSPERKARSTSGGAAAAGRAMTRAAPHIARAKFGDTLFITNNLPYIVPLENGHSKKAPNGMVKLTVTEIEAYWSQLVRSLP